MVSTSRLVVWNACLQERGGSPLRRAGDVLALAPTEVTCREIHFRCALPDLPHACASSQGRPGDMPRAQCCRPGSVTACWLDEASSVPLRLVARPDGESAQDNDDGKSAGRQRKEQTKKTGAGGKPRATEWRPRRGHQHSARRTTRATGGSIYQRVKKCHNGNDLLPGLPLGK